jgi:phospholipase/carboxylesterase
MSLDSYTFAETEGAPDAPLVFAFHGTGGDERQFLGFLAGAVPGAAVIAPRGDVSEAGALRFFRRRGEGLYDMVDLARRRDRLAAFVAAHVARQPGRRVLGLGYSNGANILAAMTFAQPAIFDAVALMHPLIPWQPSPAPDLAGRRVLITAGAADPIASLPATEALKDWYRAQGAEVSHLIHPGGHAVTADEANAVARFLSQACDRSAAA